MIIMLHNYRSYKRRYYILMQAILMLVGSLFEEVNLIFSILS